MNDQWVNITIDVSKLENCQLIIQDILETVGSFRVVDLPMELYCAYYAIGEAVKWLKFFNGDIEIDSLREMWRSNVCNIYPDRQEENLRFLRR